MRLNLPTLMAVVFVCSVLTACEGCISHKKPSAELPPKIENGFAYVDAHIAEILFQAAALGNSADPKARDAGNVITRHGNEVKRGNAVAQKQFENCQQDNDKSRQGYYRLLDYTSWLAGIGFGVGVGVCVISILNGGKLGAGLGVTAIGGSTALTMMIMRAASPALVWTAYGLAGIIVAAVAYIVWDRLHVHKKLKSQENNGSDSDSTST